MRGRPTGRPRGRPPHPAQPPSPPHLGFQLDGLPLQLAHARLLAVASALRRHTVLQLPGGETEAGERSSRGAAQRPDPGPGLTGVGLSLPG